MRGSTVQRLAKSVGVKAYEVLYWHGNISSAGQEKKK